MDPNIETKPAISVPPAVPGYQLLKPLGQGAMGSVFLAYEENLGRRVALKVMTEEFASATGALAQFGREARTMATVEHPHVVRIYSFGDAGTAEHPRPFLAMEFIEGTNLDEKIQREGRLPIEEALRITHEAAQGLRAAWKQRIVHRDIKPANLLIDLEGRVRVGDFGIAKPLEKENGALTVTGITLGTPRYLSPEQAMGDNLDFRSDIYSLGVLLWESLVGEPPFGDDNVIKVIQRHINEELPTLAATGIEATLPLQHLIRKMTAKNRDHRFDSYDELLDAITELLSPSKQPSGNEGQSQANTTATSHQSSDEGWYFSSAAGQQVGPMARSHLITLLTAGEISGDTYVWGPGFVDWKLASEIIGDRPEEITNTGAQNALSLLSAQGTQSSSLYDEMSNVTGGPGTAPLPLGSTVVLDPNANKAYQAAPESSSAQASGVTTPEPTGEEETSQEQQSAEPQPSESDPDDALSKAWEQAVSETGSMAKLQADRQAGDEKSAEHPQQEDSATAARATDTQTRGTEQAEHEGTEPQGATPEEKEHAETPDDSSQETASEETEKGNGDTDWFVMDELEELEALPAATPAAEDQAQDQKKKKRKSWLPKLSLKGKTSKNSQTGSQKTLAPVGPLTQTGSFDRPKTSSYSPPPRQNKATGPVTGIDAVLNAVDAKLQDTRQMRARRGISLTAARARFSELRNSAFKPAFRDFMMQLHAKGHPCKLNDKGSDSLRLEFMLDAQARCALEIALTPKGTIAFRFYKNMGMVLEEEATPSDIEPNGVGDKLTQVLSRGLGLA